MLNGLSVANLTIQQSKVIWRADDRARGKRLRKIIDNALKYRLEENEQRMVQEAKCDDVLEWLEENLHESRSEYEIRSTEIKSFSAYLTNNFISLYSGE